jgi:hypothetical protein
MVLQEVLDEILVAVQALQYHLYGYIFTIQY